MDVHRTFLASAVLAAPKTAVIDAVVIQPGATWGSAIGVRYDGRLVVYAADAQSLREVGEAILASGHPVTVNAGTWEVVMFLDEVSAD